MSEKRKRRNILAIVVVGLVMFVGIGCLVFAQGLEKSIPVLVLAISLFVHLWLPWWQLHTEHTFLRGIGRTFVSVIPLFFTILAIVPFWLSYWSPLIKSDLSNILTVIYGVASIASLTFSLVVLVTLHEKLHDEIEQMESAIDLIRSVRKRLIFIALTPNLGYAKAVSKGRWQLCNDFYTAFTNKIQHLLDNASNNQDIKVRIALLNEADREAFYKKKKDFLSSFPGERSGENGAETYDNFSRILERKLKEMMQNAQNKGIPTEQFEYCEWKPGCLEQSNKPNFPPLGILIADDHMAIIHFNANLLENSPPDLKGQVLKSHEEIESFTLLVDSYVNNFKR
jgi:hypothetical protein